MVQRESGSKAENAPAHAKFKPRFKEETINTQGPEKNN
jgi:hypothetical protein